MQRQFAVLAAGLFSFYDVFQLALFNTVSSDLLSYFHTTTMMLSILAASFLWANAFGLIPIGLLLDHYSLRKIALCFLGLTSLASFGFALSSSFAFDVLLRICQGLASAASLLISMRLAIQWFEKRANFAIGCIVTLALSGGIVGNYGFAYVVEKIGWRYSLLATTLLGLVILIVLYKFLYENPNISKPQHKNFSDVIKKTKLIVLQRQNIVAGFALGFMNSPIFILGTLWGNFYLSNVYHFSITTAAALTSLLFIGIIIGALFWGYTADNSTNPCKILYLSCGVALLISILFFSQKSSSLFLIISNLFMLGFFCGSQNLIYSIISKTNSNTSLSTAIGTATLIFNGVGALLQILFGWLLKFKLYNLSGLILFPTVFALGTILIFYLNQYLMNGRQKMVVF